MRAYPGNTLEEFLKWACGIQVQGEEPFKDNFNYLISAANFTIFKNDFENYREEVEKTLLQFDQNGEEEFTVFCLNNFEFIPGALFLESAMYLNAANQAHLIAGQRLVENLRKNEGILKEAATLLKTSVESVPEAAAKLQQRADSLQEEIARLKEVV